MAEPIIDVKPINYSSTRVKAQDSKTAPGVGSARGSYDSPYRGSSYGSPYGNNTYGSPYGTGVTGGAYVAKSPSAIVGFAQIVVGAGFVMLGIPMLLLPGPGLLSIAAGGFLISRGVAKLRP